MHEKSPTTEQQVALRRIPSIETLLARDGFMALQEEYSRNLVTDILRAVVSESRRRIFDENTKLDSPDESAYLQLVRKKLRELTASRLRPLSTPPEQLLTLT